MNASINVDDETRIFRCTLFRFFFTRFFIIDFNETSREQRKQSILNLFTKLFTSWRNETIVCRWWQKSEFQTACWQRSALFERRRRRFSRHHRQFRHFHFFLSLLHSLRSFFFRDFLRRFLFFLHFLLLLLDKVRIECDLRRNTILSVDAKFLLRRETRIDRDDDAKAFERTSEDIVHTLIDITFNRALRSVDLERLTSSIKARQNIYHSASDIFKNFHEIRESIELTSNDEEILLLVRALAFSLLHQFSKKQHLAHSRDATNVILSENDDNRDLLENLSRDNIKRRINLQWLIIDTSSTNWRHSYNHADSIETFATIANETIHVKDAFEKRILDKKLDTSLTTFRFRVLLEDDLEKFRQRSIKLDNIEISREKISHRRHHESFKKNLFLSRQKKSTERVAKLKNETKEKFDQKRRKRNLFLNRRTSLHLIFVFFTTHFRIHHLLFTAFLIHERRSLSMNFRKNHTKNSIWILNRSKWSSSRWIMRETSISRMRDAWFLAWKKTFTVVNDNRDLHDVFSS